MTLKELADKLESLDVNVFANILGLEYTHGEQPEQAKKMIINALRFSEKNGLRAQRQQPDDADWIAPTLEAMICGRSPLTARNLRQFAGRSVGTKESERQ